MKFTKIKVVAIVVVPLLSGACVVAAANYLMSGLEPPRITAARACVPGDAPTYHVARHGRPTRREVGASAAPATGTPRRAATDQKVANDGHRELSTAESLPAGNGN